MKVLVRPGAEGGYVAVLLDPFIAVQARTAKGIMSALMLSLAGNIGLAWKHGQEPFANVGKADPEAWAAFERATFVQKQPLPQLVDGMPDIEAEWRKAVEGSHATFAFS